MALRSAVFAMVATLLLSPAYALQPQPLTKNSVCPSGYGASGEYCVPSARARYAVPKVGVCPSGYSGSGNYCLAGTNAKPAIPKHGVCPSGYSPSNSYCLGNK